MLKALTSLIYTDTAGNSPCPADKSTMNVCFCSVKAPSDGTVYNENAIYNVTIATAKIEGNQCSVSMG